MICRIITIRNISSYCKAEPSLIPVFYKAKRHPAQTRTSVDTGSQIRQHFRVKNRPAYRRAVLTITLFGQEMRTRLTTILGLVLVGIAAVVVVQSRVRKKSDASTGGIGSHGTANPKRPILDPATFKPTKLPRSSQRASSEELIRQADLHYTARNYEEALELAILAVDRAPNGESALPPQLRTLLRVLQGEPLFVGTILNAEYGSSGDLYISAEQPPARTPARVINFGEIASPGGADSPPEVSHLVPEKLPIIVRPDSVTNLGDYRKGDVVKVWASCIKASLPGQADAFRIQKVK